MNRQIIRPVVFLSVLALGLVRCVSGSQVVDEFVIRPSTLEFGSALLNQQVTKTFSISAVSSVVKVASIAVAGTDAAMFSVTQGAADVQPNETLMVTVTFKPTSAGLKSARLVITVNDTQAPERLVALHGNGVTSLPFIDLASCAGTGLIDYIGSMCLEDFGFNGATDNVEIYCESALPRFCLTHEECPWRDGGVSNDGRTCSRAGLSTNLMANVISNVCHNSFTPDMTLCCASIDGGPTTLVVTNDGGCDL